ncbi:MAG: adenylate/guanylate cyclase domain-containing protein [Planctomycetota bacterium]
MSEIPRVKLTFVINGRESSETLVQDRIVIGRSPSCDLTVKDERVSRKHATIIREPSGWSVFDMQSANGTKVNDAEAPVIKSKIKSGDTIWLGEVRLQFELEKLPASRLSGSRGHRVVFEEDAARSNKTAIFNMADLNLGSDSSDLSIGDSSQAAAWAVSLFAEAAQALLASGGLDEMFDKIIDLIFKNLPAERAVVALFDSEKNEIIPRVTRTRDDRNMDPIKVSHSIAMEAIRCKQAFRVGDALSDQRFGQEESIINLNIQSAMCAPMFAPDSADHGVCGILYVDYVSRLKPFSEENLRLLSALAVFSAVAVEQRRLQERIIFEESCRDKLAKYNSKHVVDKILSDARSNKTGLHQIGGMMTEEREVTILFGDLSGFTAMSENMTPQDTAAMLNVIFEKMTNCIFEFDGTLDKFMGDGMMAFFGAPIEQPDHAERAVRAALRMQQELKLWNAEHEGQEVAMRIGINSGPVVAGDIGSPERKDYTVIGDTVNTASRLESTVAKPGQVVIGPLTFEMIGDYFDCEATDVVPLKGKTKAVQPYLVKSVRD